MLDSGKGFGGNVGQYGANEKNGCVWVEGLVSAAVDSDSGRR